MRGKRHRHTLVSSAELHFAGGYKLFLEWLTLPSLLIGLTLPHAVVVYW